MDHLPLPRAPHPQPGRVPCVCNEDELYNSDDFAAFPGKRGWSHLLTVDGRPPYFITSQNTTFDDQYLRQEEKFLQAWVFFGLLSEMLRPLSLYDANDYIEIGEDGSKLLHTRELHHTIVQWHNRMKELTSVEKSRIVDHVRKCLVVAVEVVWTLNNKNHQSFNWMIKMSLITMCSTIEGMILSQLDGSIHILQPQASLKDDQQIRETMLSNGWCPSEISNAMRDTTSIPTAQWYMQHLRKNDDPASHAKCTNNVCTKSQIAAGYCPQHVCTTGDCDSVGPSLGGILACLVVGDIPVLEVVDDENDLAIIIHPLRSLDKDKTSYVAFSHVWADGLGNMNEMSLPRCQVQRLSRLVLEMKSHTFLVGANAQPYSHPERVMLWCDTLCCPIEPEGKSLALALMRDVYMKASFTLVLDNELQCHSYSEIGVVEAGCRVITSRWMTRLWTFQEAELAQRLIIQFADQPVSVVPMFKTLLHMYLDSPMRERTYIAISSGLSALRAWSTTGSKTAWIAQAVLGLGHRRVSFAADEPLCLATILGLDSRTLKAPEAAQRMADLWKLLVQHPRGVGYSVIFTSLERLSISGFRWAPASFLQSLERAADTIVPPSDTTFSELTPQGLLVRCAGWRLRYTGRADDLPASSHSTNRILAARQKDGSWYNIARLPLQSTTHATESPLAKVVNPDKQWFIILQRGNAKFAYERWSSQETALLVSKTIIDSAFACYRTEMLVGVDRVQPAFEQQIVYDQTCIEIEETFDSSTEWCVD